MFNFTSFLKEPKRNPDGSLDLEWYKNLSEEEAQEYEIWENEIPEELQKQESPLEVVIKDNNINASKIKEYKGEGVKKFEFRPQEWEQFIGQTEAKERAKTIMKKAKQRMKAHFLVDGIKGHGKTTFVELFAKSINAHIIKRIGKQLNEDNLVDVINEINECENEHIVFFVDEIDTMDWKVVKVLNPVIESFEIMGKKIKPFIFAGATINKHILIEKNPDTLDRIPAHIKFERYNAEEITTILKQYVEQLYPDSKIEDKDLMEIAKNCKFNPRTSIALLEEFIVERDIPKVLKNWHIIKDGLNHIDIRLLKTLNASSRAMGANSLAMKCGLSQNEYIREFEPFLVEYDYINRVPSRIITEKGRNILNEL